MIGCVFFKDQSNCCESGRLEGVKGRNRWTARTYASLGNSS